jgi:hypothetical protein
MDEKVLNYKIATLKVNLCRLLNGIFEIGLKYFMAL